MKYFSYVLNVMLIGFIGFMAYKFIYDGNVATATDERIAVILTAEEKAEVLAEMRGMLETAQAVILAASSDDVAAIPAFVEPFGMAAAENESVTLMSKIPFEMKTMGFEAHGAMDTLGEMAENGASGAEIIETLGETMSLCTGCHSSYRIVTEAELE